jgi:hypothetical protein
VSLVRAIVGDLREKRLWLAAAALVAALVAVPLLLSRSAASPSSGGRPQTYSASGGGAPAAPLVQAAASAGSIAAGLSGAARDPFAQRSSGQASVAATTAPGATAGGAGASGAGASSSDAGSGASSVEGASGAAGAGVSAGGETSPPALPPVKRPPAPEGLTATESYRVAFAITNSAGGFGTIDSLERLSPIPSAKQPLLVELGVLKGGQRVLFAVLSGAAVGGPGLCIPGHVDCEIVSLAPGQVETLSRMTATGVERIAYFAVTGIAVDHHPSAAAAQRARLSASAQGQRLLAASKLAALSLFRYEPALGSLLDLRNLVIGDES